MAVTLNANTSTGFIATSDTSGILQLQTGGTTAVTVNASANVGINTASPGYKFEVAHNQNGAATSAVSNTSSGASASARFLSLGDGGNASFGMTSSGYTDITGATDALLISAGNASGGMVFALDGVSKMKMDSSGNVGIGYTSPVTKLDVFGAIRAGSGSDQGTQLNMWTGAGGDAGIAAFTLSFNTGANSARTQRMYIDSSGALTVGTSAAPTTGPHVIQNNGNGATIANLLNYGNSTPYGIYVSFQSAAPNNNTQYFYYAIDNAATRFVVKANGGINNYTANNVNLSDQREKTNFAPAGDYLAKICAIPVQTFNYIDQNMEEDDGLTLGVVAQDVEAVAPELVIESNWGTEEEPKMRLGIYQTDLQYALMKCIQEQQAIITSLTDRITALEGTTP